MFNKELRSKEKDLKLREEEQNRKDIDLKVREEEQKNKELRDQRRKYKAIKAMKEEEERKKKIEYIKITCWDAFLLLHKCTFRYMNQTETPIYS